MFGNFTADFEVLADKFGFFVSGILSQKDPMASASQYGRGLVGKLKRGWNEIPGVMGSTVMALIGLGLGITGVKANRDSGKIAPTYKKSYIVYRPDDPRVNKPTHDWI